jgi:hypothetical protein
MCSDKLPPYITALSPNPCTVCHHGHQQDVCLPDTLRPTLLEATRCYIIPHSLSQIGQLAKCTIALWQLFSQQVKTQRWTPSSS